MNAYVDSSVVLSLLLSESELKIPLTEYIGLITSEICRIECLRVLSRLELEGTLSEKDFIVRKTKMDEFLKTTRVVRLRSMILARASGKFPTHVRTLDAIHLATCLIAGEVANESVPMLTRDNRLRAASLALGIEAPEI